MAKIKESQSRPVVARLIAFGLRALSWLPLGVAQSIGSCLGWAVWSLNLQAAKRTKINLQLCLPHASKAERQRLGKESLRETMGILMQSGAHLYWPPDKLHRAFGEVHGLALLRDALTCKSGTLLLVPHVGAWEMMNVYLLSLGLPLTALYRPPRIAELDGVVRAARERTGSELVPATGAGVRRLFKALREGRLVAILPDQEPGPTGGEFVTFYNVPAWTMTLASRLANKSGAAALFGFVERNGRKYDIHFRRVPSEFFTDVVGDSVEAMNRGIEKCIDVCPAQYQWSYKRFRSRPPGMPYLYPRVIKRGK